MSNTPNTEDWQWLEDALDDLQFESITSPSGDSATKLKAIRDAKATITARIQQLTEAAEQRGGVRELEALKDGLGSGTIARIARTRIESRIQALHPQDTTRGQE